MAERAIRPVLDGLFNIVGALDNVVVARADATDTDASVVLGHVLLGKTASLLGKGSREHEVEVVRVLVDVCVGSACEW